MPDYSRLISKRPSSPKDFFEGTLTKTGEIKSFYEENDMKKIKNSPFKIPTLGLIDPKKKVKKVSVKDKEKDAEKEKEKDKEKEKHKDGKVKSSSSKPSKKEEDKTHNEESGTESSGHKSRSKGRSSKSKKDTSEDNVRPSSLHKKDKEKEKEKEKIKKRTSIPLNSLLKGKVGSFRIHSSMFSLEEGGEFYIVKKLKLDQEGEGKEE